MKCIWVFFLCAAAACAADAGFVTGQAARLVIGQKTFTSQDDLPADSLDSVTGSTVDSNGIPVNTILGGVGGVAWAANRLFVADSNRVGSIPLNHRVLMFRTDTLPLPTDLLANVRECPACQGTASLVLGQPDLVTNTEPTAATQNTLRLPTAVASDGIHLVVADTNHNRVLIWNSIPTGNNQNADVVVGQPDFVSVSFPGNTPTASSMRGPQGVWIQNGKLYVADTQNNRVLVFNQIPTKNGAAADLVLGAKDFNTFVEPDLSQQKTSANASNMLNPVSVTTDGFHLFVTDIGYQRVLIWNTMPTTNGAAADAVVGQPNLTSSLANNAFTVDTTNKNKETPVLCSAPILDSNGNVVNDTNGNPTYPTTCNSTLSFPRFALSDGKRLFIADGGNDRVLIFAQIPGPGQYGLPADVILGQIGGGVNQASDAADSLRTPMSLAWDGSNLYVADTYNRRIAIYTVEPANVPYTGVRNAASLEIYAVGSVTVSGTITAKDTATITISTTPPSGTAVNTDYTYTIQTNDTLDIIVNALVKAINGANNGKGDPNVIAVADLPTETVLLRARSGGTDGNNVGYSVKASTNATIILTATGANLTGGGDAAQVAPGTIVAIQGNNLSFGSGVADPGSPWPYRLANTEVYFDGFRSPLIFVSPTQVNAQVPWEFNDTTSVNCWVRSVATDGTVRVTSPVAVTIVPQNPGIFTYPGTSVGRVLHASSQATGVIELSGTPAATDIATITIEDRSYTYTIQTATTTTTSGTTTTTTNDTLDTIRDGLVAAIMYKVDPTTGALPVGVGNTYGAPDPKVTAAAGAQFDWIVLTARVAGPDGNGIAFNATTSNSSDVTLSPTTTALCCANVAYSPVTDLNPAVPGENILVYATGLGLPVIPLTDPNNVIGNAINTGAPYNPSTPTLTNPVAFVSALAGGKTANVVTASLKPGTVGIFEVVMQLNSGLTSDPQTQLTIAQSIYVSNVVTIPVSAP